MPDTLITSPGIYPAVPVAEYFADPCPQPSLTQSVAKILLDRSPLHAWHAHPRLNPDFLYDDATKYDIGNIAHALMIGRGKSIEVIEGHDDWRTKAAKTQREACAAAGKLGVLGRHYAKAARMVEAARVQLAMRGLKHLFEPEAGDGELVLAWREGETWMRQMLDWLAGDRRTFADYKTTAMSAAPHGLARMMATAGWPIQAAMADRGLKVLDPLGYRRRFLFVVQEDEHPYQINVVEMSEGALTMGGKMLDAAVQIWTRCVAQNIWPGYPLDNVIPDYPAWAETQWLDREETEFAQPRSPADMRGHLGPDHLMAG